VLQDRVLAPLLGIDDPRTSKRIDFIGGIRGTGELESRVRDGPRRRGLFHVPDHGRTAYGHRRCRGDHAPEEHMV